MPVAEGTPSTVILPYGAGKSTAKGMPVAKVSRRIKH